jgi:hypothetical protein
MAGEDWFVLSGALLTPLALLASYALRRRGGLVMMLPMVALIAAHHLIAMALAPW